MLAQEPAVGSLPPSTAPMLDNVPDNGELLEFLTQLGDEDVLGLLEEPQRSKPMSNTSNSISNLRYALIA